MTCAQHIPVPAVLDIDDAGKVRGILWCCKRCKAAMQPKVSERRAA